MTTGEMADLLKGFPCDTPMVRIDDSEPVRVHCDLTGVSVAKMKRSHGRWIEFHGENLKGRNDTDVVVIR